MACIKGLYNNFALPKPFDEEFENQYDGEITLEKLNHFLDYLSKSEIGVRRKLVSMKMFLEGKLDFIVEKQLLVETKIKL
jgi:hypothetical protein